MDEEYLLGVIADIEKQKDEKHVLPRVAMREDIMGQIYKEMQDCLARLLQKKKINYHKTLNSWSVETV